MNGAEAAALFRGMADRIERNASEEFAGAYLIVPPGEGKAIDGVTVTSTPSETAFWANTTGALDLAVTEYKAAQEQTGRRRGY